MSFSLFATGLYQELPFRGFLQNRFAQFLGGDRVAWHRSIALTSALFGLLHLGLSPANAVMAGLAGLVFGEMYLWSDRNLWVVVAAHSLGNSLMTLYWSRQIFFG